MQSRDVVPSTPGIEPTASWPEPAASQARRAGDAALDVLTLATSVAAQPKDAAFSAIRLIRAVTAGRFSQQLREEWAALTAAGKIKPDYEQSEQARVIFADTLQGLEDANFDEEQLELLRKLFLAAASETLTDRHNVLVREYIDIGRTLTAVEIRILAAYHHYLPEWATIARKTRLHDYAMAQAHDVVRNHSGLQHIGLIARHERSLIEKGLVLPALSTNPDLARVDPKLYRFSDFGLAFCEFIATYERLKG